MVPLAIVGHLDGAILSRFDRLAGIVAHSASATRLHATDNQWHVSRVREMEGIGHHLALQQGAEVMPLIVKLDDGLLLRVFRRRLGAGHQIGGEFAVAFVVA